MFPWYGNVTNSSCIENYSTICIDQRMSFKKMQFWHKNNCCILESIIFIGDTNFHMQALFASTLTFVIKIHTITHRTKVVQAVTTNATTNALHLQKSICFSSITATAEWKQSSHNLSQEKQKDIFNVPAQVFVEFCFKFTKFFFCLSNIFL